MDDWLSRTARSYPNRPIMLSEGFSITYRELDNQVDACVYRLFNYINSDSRIAVMGNVSSDVIEVILAAMRVQIPICILNPLQPQSVLQDQLAFADISLVVGTEEDIAHLSASIAVLTFTELRASSSIDVEDIQLDLDKPSVYLFTSGTSGDRKLVEFSYRNFLTNALGSALRLGHSHDDIWLLTIPIYHVGGLSILFRAILNGISIFINTSSFTIDRFKSITNEFAISIVSLVPTMFQRLMKDPSGLKALQSLRVILIGGAKLPTESVKNALELNLPLHTTYGLTETCAQAATALPEQLTLNPQTSGTPLWGTEIRIMSSEGSKLLANEIGEIQIHSDAVAIQYYKRPDLSKERFQNGWLITGDLGYFDDSGFLVVLSRRDEMIISGGENIYPSLVEDAYLYHQAITNIAVFGIEDLDWGQRVVAAVQLSTPLDVNELKAFGKSQLATYEVPKEFLIFEEFPILANGKIDRKALRSELEQRINTKTPTSPGK